MKNLLQKRMKLWTTQLASICFLLLLATMQVNAQDEITVTGKVTDEMDEMGIPGVNVSIQGTNTGTVTDASGNYRINVPGQETTLIYSFVGYAKQEVQVGNRSVIDISLGVGTQELSEVVVTALNIERETKALGYSVQEVAGDELVEARDPNLVNSLAGKVAGVQITAGNSGAGSTSRIVIRGESSFNYSEPLFVVDGVPISNRTNMSTSANNIADNMELDFGNGAAEISPDDVESISILKGPSATALYGSRGANGVVLITTKSAKGKKGLGVSFNTGVTFETILASPEYQDKFGQGKNGEFDFVDGYGSGTFDGVDESWGPRLDGRPIRQFDGPTANGLRGGDVHGLDRILGSKGVDLNRRGEITPTPWMFHGDPVDQFFETGVTQNYNVSFYGANEEGDFRLSYTNMSNDGILPNTDLMRNNFTLSGGYNLSDKLKVDANITYVATNSDNRAVNSYGTESIMYLFTWYGMQINTTSLRDYWQDGLEGFQQYNYNYNYHDNPYFNMFENTNGLDKNRMFGNISATYQFTPELSLMVRAGTDYFDELRTIKRAYSTQRFPKGQYREDKIRLQEINTDFLLNYNKSINPDWNVGLSLGGNRMVRKDEFDGASANELVIPGFYSFDNSAIPLATATANNEKQINSFYGMAQIGYKNMIFLDVTGRNDWSSKLSSRNGNNSYFYPSVSLSTSLTDMFLLPAEISFWKIRGSWAQAGNDTEEWALNPVYVFGERFGDNPRIQESTTLPNPDLVNELSTSFEVGTDLRLFNEKLRLDFTYYNSTTENQIVRRVVPHSTGYVERYENFGKVVNQGFEVMLGLTPLTIDNGFNWNLNFNFSRNINEITELTGVEYPLAGNRVTLKAVEGGAMGDMYGTGLVRHDDGQLVLVNGLPQEDPEQILLGNYNPDFILGINNSFAWKGFSANVLFDWRQGGDLMSLTRLIAATAGNVVETLPGRDEEFGGIPYYLDDDGQKIRLPDHDASAPDGGTVYHDGIIAEGYMDEGGTLVENDVIVAASAYYNKRYKRQNEAEGMYDASFVKLREVRFGYQLPPKLLSNLPFQKVKLSFVGRNLMLWNNFNHGDSELISYTGGGSMVLGVEDMALPATRSWGFNLSVDF